MRLRLVALILAASLAPIARGQVVLRPGDRMVVKGNVTIHILVDCEPGSPSQPLPPLPPTPAEPPPPTPAEPPAEPPGGKVVGPEADFAGASRMYLRGIPLGLRQVAGRVGTDIKTLDELKDEIEAARKRANNGLARRLARRWVGCFDSAGNIVNPKPIVDGLNEAAHAMEAGLR
jgi:hypothetical protein